MSRMHILQKNGGLYDAVIHAPVPKGTNSAGIEWSAAIVVAGLNRTSLPAAIISEDEAKQIAAGEVIEGPYEWGEDEGLKNPSEDAVVVGLVEFGDIDAMAAFQMPTNEALQKLSSNRINREIVKLIEETMARLDRYGETVA